MWQKCPICNGTGEITLQDGNKKTCDTCNGTKMISTVNGKPPTNENKTINNNNKTKLIYS